MNTAAAYSFDALFAATARAVMLAFLVGDDRPRKALFLARDVLEQFPAVFPEFAALLADDPTSPRGACWSLAELLADCAGSYDLHARARELARA